MPEIHFAGNSSFIDGLTIDGFADPWLKLHFPSMLLSPSRGDVPLAMPTPAPISKITDGKVLGDKQKRQRIKRAPHVILFLVGAMDISVFSLLLHQWLQDLCACACMCAPWFVAADSSIKLERPRRLARLDDTHKSRSRCIRPCAEEKAWKSTPAELLELPPPG